MLQWPDDMYAFLWGSLGAALTEIATVAYRIRKSGRIGGVRYASYWVVGAAFVILGGIVAALFQPQEPVVAVAIGATLPIFVDVMFRRLAAPADTVDPILSEIESSSIQRKRDNVEIASEALTTALIGAPNMDRDSVERLVENFRADLARDLRARDQELEQQAVLLRVYNQGIRDARSSFVVSIGAAIVGAVFIFTGVGVGIFRNGDQGVTYASIVTTLSGVVTNIIAAVFIIQSSQARRHLFELVRMLRTDNHVTAQILKALEITARIQDTATRDETLADLVSKLVVAAPLAAIKPDADAEPARSK